MDLFVNRQHAGQDLAKKLISYAKEHPLILAIPRGGLPIGFEIAKTLACPLDILMVKKIGAPRQPELAIGAITEEGQPYFNLELVKTLGVSHSYMKKTAEEKLTDLREQTRKFRRGKAAQNVKERTVILVDDGIATGTTLLAATQILKQQNVKKLIVAAPVGARDSIEKLRQTGVEVVCPLSPANFEAVGLWYQDFPQVSDEEVISLLDEARYLVKHQNSDEEISIHDGSAEIQGTLTKIPESPGLILFAHGSGSGRHSPRNQRVAHELNKSGFSTFLFDLLSEQESTDRSNVFNIELLARRLLLATDEVLKYFKDTQPKIGYFGASTGAGAALMAAAQSKHTISAVVSRGGRPDLADLYLKKVSAPTLLIVGGNDPSVLELNKKAAKDIANYDIAIVPGAGHLFEEPGTMEEVIEYASQWFRSYLLSPQKEKFPKEEVLTELEKRAHSIRDSHSWDELIESLSSHRIVMLGESTHGTQEFYNIRRHISERLIQDYGFDFIAVEGDWPDSQKLNDYIHMGKGGSAQEVMRQFQRWPTWMWANDETAGMIEWMRNYGTSFYGLDVYSLFESLDYVKDFAKNLDPEMAKSVLEGYACFDPFQRNEKAYARYLTKFDEGCRHEVVKNLRKMLRLRLEELRVSSPQLLNAQQNARIITHAEQYYRSMLFGGAESWNIRDHHMIDTLDTLLHHTGKNSKCIVWAHNSHIGDYHATDMLEEGYVNLGGLAREHFGINQVALVGFGTYEGQVLASSAWDGPK